VTLTSGLEVTKLVPFESLVAVSYSPFIVTIAVSLTVYEIFSVKLLRDLENWVMGCSRSLKLAPFDRPYIYIYDFLLVRYCKYGVQLPELVHTTPQSTFIRPSPCSLCQLRTAKTASLLVGVWLVIGESC